MWMTLNYENYQKQIDERNKHSHSVSITHQHEQKVFHYRKNIYLGLIFLYIFIKLAKNEIIKQFLINNSNICIF